MTSYRKNILLIINELLARLDFRTILDFGCGDGWFFTNFSKSLKHDSIIPLDVLKRDNCAVDPVIYSGDDIPFSADQFDLVYSIDVLHHCTNPEASLRELMRCTNRYLVIKDHNYFGFIGWLVLCILDEIGNRRFKIPSNYKYQKCWSWVEFIEANGFKRIALIAPAKVHRGLLGALTNRLQFVGVWEKVGRA